MGSGGGCDLEPAPVPEGRATRASPRYPKYTLVSSAHASVLQLISPVDGGAADQDDPNRLSGFKFTDEETGAQYLVEGFKEFKMVVGKQVRSFTVRILEISTVKSGSRATSSKSCTRCMMLLLWLMMSE